MYRDLYLFYVRCLRQSVLEPNFANDGDGKSDYGNPYLFTGRRVDFLDDGNLTLQINRHRYYDYYTGRWLTQDPLGITLHGERYADFAPGEQYKDGLNIYEYSNSNPVRNVDPLGLWDIEHSFITVAGLVSVRDSLVHPSPTAKCWAKIIAILVFFNVGQDAWGMGLLELHYTRPPATPGSWQESLYRVTYDAAYDTYLSVEKSTFITCLAQLKCFSALAALGRMDHSLQDFYAHAIRRDGLGGKENSDFPGWTAWSVGVTGTPYSRSKFWPSSYPQEHPAGVEPITKFSAEYFARLNAVYKFMNNHYAAYLVSWWKKCHCWCNCE